MGDKMGISIRMVCGENGSASSIRAVGELQHIITDDEQKTFNIAPNDVLKSYIEKYMGKAPKNVYLHSPTGEIDLYKRFAWNEVQVHLHVESAEIMGITMEPVILGSAEQVNHRNKPMEANTGITQNVRCTSRSSWHTENTISIGHDIEASCEFLGIGAKSTTSFSYGYTWGESGEQSTEIEVGVSNASTVPIDPGEGIRIELSASRGTMKVRIKYKAWLTGHAALHYGPQFKGHYFYASPIVNILNANGLPTFVTSVQDIDIGFYTNSRIDVYDLKTEKLVASNSVDNLPMKIILPKEIAAD
jgi:hypothetical protein